MSKKLHEAALAAATEAAEDWVWDETGSWPTGMPGDEVLVLAYVAHLLAHGVKLTARLPTEAMADAGLDVAYRDADYDVENDNIVIQTTIGSSVWHVMHDAAPSWPGDAE